MTFNAVADSPCKIKAFSLFFKPFHNPHALEIVLEAVGTDFVENSLTAMTEWGMSEVVTKGNSLSESLV
jgi:hypothetical protein